MTELIGAPSRRAVLKGLAAGARGGRAGPRFVQAQSSAPIRLGFQLHRTGIGAAYGRWYERTATAALAVLNEAGGINGRPVEILFEDDGTDPKRGAEVVEKFASRERRRGLRHALLPRRHGQRPARRRAARCPTSSAPRATTSPPARSTAGRCSPASPT